MKILRLIVNRTMNKNNTKDNIDRVDIRMQTETLTTKKCLTE